jgi:SNF2 family DNA or RNA helicase
MSEPHILRHLKADVLKDMPIKSEFIVSVELSQIHDFKKRRRERLLYAEHHDGFKKVL